MRFKETTNYFCPECDENMFSFEAQKITVKRKIRRHKAKR